MQASKDAPMPASDSDRVVCSDCGIGLVASDMWEPVIAIGRFPSEHTAICQACIADIADVRYYNLVSDVVAQCRKELANDKYHGYLVSRYRD